MSTKIFQSRRAVSLVEMIITLTVFAVVSMIALTVLSNSLRTSKRIQAQVFLYSEAQATMDQLARAVERSTIDYEAYYAREVQGETGWATDDYGFYAQSFYHPGDDGPTNSGPYFSNYSIGGYDADCPSGAGVYPDDCNDEIPVTDDLDTNTYAHPFAGISAFNSSLSEDPDTMNAFCEGSDCTALDHNVAEELILVNGSGDERIVFLRELADSGTDYSLNRVKLRGTDTDSDGIVDTWACTSAYSCTGTDDTPAEGDFLPITPPNIDIESFYVYISPTEDPYRAVAEENIQVQPQVTILMTVSLSDSYSNGILGNNPTITLQRSVSAGVYSAVESYE